MVTRSAAILEPPLLPGSRITGSLTEVNQDFLGTMMRAAREIGPLARIICGPPGWRETLYIVSSPELAETVRVAYDPDVGPVI